MKPFHRLAWLILTCSLLIAACAPAAPAPTLRAPTFEPPPAIPTATPIVIPTAPPSPTATAPTGAVTASGAFDPAQLKSNLDTWVAAAIQANGGTACSVAVVYPNASGQLQTDFYNYGTLSKDSSTAVNSTTVYEIGSLTKLFTSDVLASLVIAGQATLEDPIKAYLPSGTTDPEYLTQPITLEELSTHTSGLPLDFSITGQPEPVDINGQPSLDYVTDAEIMHQLTTYQLLRAPGSQWEYSNAGYAVLGLLVERITNTPFDKLVQSKISGPLGLSDTRVVLTPAESSNRAQGYTAEGKAGIQFAPSGAMLSSGGLRSTAKDLAAYLAANIEPQASQLGPALQLTQQAQGVGPDATTAMGLGWMIGQAGTSQAVYYKGGSTDGYSAYIAFWPGTKIGFALLCNGQAVKDLAPKITQALGGPNTPVDTNP